MKSYFVHISGECIELARTETEVLVGVWDSSVRVQWKGLFGFFQAPSSVDRYLLSRSAYVKEAGRIVFKLGEDLNLTPEFLISLVHEIENNNDFRVDVIGSSSFFSRKAIESLISEIVKYLKERSGSRVNLSNPAKRISLLLDDANLMVCVSQKSELRCVLRRKTPNSRNFFHPSMMNAYLARALCNLAGVSRDDTMLDPFCGAGGILVEGASLNARVIGLDINWRLLNGARSNLDDIDAEYALIQGDARHIPISRCTSIVSDPPYGRVSSTHGSESLALIDETLNTLLDRVTVDGKICFCSTTKLDVPKIMERLGLKIQRLIHVRVHRSLTRRIVLATT